MNDAAKNPTQHLDVAMPSEDSNLDSRVNPIQLFGTAPNIKGFTGDSLSNKGTGCPACAGYIAAHSAGCTAYPWGK